MLREIIHIDENLCDGCGLCVPSCHEGALKVIDGKVRLVSELACDGLGACIGNCPKSAISIIKREALPYDEIEVVKKLIKQGRNTLVAHLKHLKDHRQTIYFDEAIGYLTKNKPEADYDLDNVIAEVINTETINHDKPGGCPGSMAASFKPAGVAAENSIPVSSELSHWPVQLHLINPVAAYFTNSDFVLAADCAAYAFGNFHNKFLKGRTLAIACPKLDQDKEVYIGKIKKLICEAEIKSMHTIIMQVPCCSGLLRLTEIALNESNRKIPVHVTIVGTNGTIVREN